MAQILPPPVPSSSTPSPASSASSRASSVTVRREPVILPTYEPLAADKNPMFLEKRVYQGSTGKVYPLPFIDRIADAPRDVSWDAIHLENEFLYVMILPQIGGRIHVARDKTNGYDFIYRQDVIKPALVGLAGPWISGGIEFNWPQHHRPSTFMPADVHIEHHDDGAITVWLGEHEPMNRMKGMHGVCLHPGRALIELKARVYNRTPHPQTFLWWANVATRVHEHYQSFFPTDVSYVADHAKRAMSTFPLADGHYYGVPYGERARSGVPSAETPTAYAPPAGRYAPNDLSWYANIPVPTSYMCMGTEDDFFGGYDHRARAGLVHVASHHIAPGKKQWTWGNHAFGYAWDRNLTDLDAAGEYAPYIELMAGVYTDNQPDFSHLQPGESRTWSQYWYPIREIGPAHQAGLDAAASLHVEKNSARVGVAVTSSHAELSVTLSAKGKVLARWQTAASPSAPFTAQSKLPRGTSAAALTLRVVTGDGRELLAFTPRAPAAAAPVPPAATEPAAPADIASADELFITGLHLDQYRHATRSPAAYWREALRRDPGDSRCHLALGRWHLQRGEFTLAEPHLRASIARLTLRNPNPADGEAHYQLGLVLRHLGRPDEAYAALYKATWNHAWQAPAHHALAELDAARRDWPAALDHLDRALRVGTDNLRARALKILVLRTLGRTDEALEFLRATRALDPLDAWTRHLDGDDLAAFPTATRLDVAHDYARAGFLAEALALLAAAAQTSAPDSGTAPLLHYTRAWLYSRAGDAKAALRARASARAASPDYCFPARLEDIHILEHALAADPSDARASYYLGNLFYDRRRHAEALALWQTSARLDPSFPTVWRNLGIAFFNIAHRPAKARSAYEKAFAANPADARVLFERDQLWKRLGVAPAKRLRELEKHAALVATRDDLSVEFCALCNQTGRPEKALPVVATRRFQPWEGGEGQALGQHVRTHRLLARRALAAGDTATAVRLLEAALASPENLGEAKHLLANQSDLRLALGDALAAAGRRADAVHQWNAAASFKGDFQEMSVRAYSELTYYSALALVRLGKKADARALLRALLDHAGKLARTPAKIDYFATSLPTMLLFDDDLDARQQTTALFLEAQARLGLGQKARAAALLRTVLKRDPAHAAAADLLVSFD